MNKEFEEIYDAHSPKITLGEQALNPSIVVFSAIPGSGKSTLTKQLVETHGFTRIANKDIRNSIEATGNIHVPIGEYTLWLLSRITENRSLRIVFDRNIDQWYDTSKQWAAQNAYNYILVRIEVSRRILERRLLYREASLTAKVFDVLDFYSEQHDNLFHKIDASIVLADDFNIADSAADIAAYCTEVAQYKASNY